MARFSCPRRPAHGGGHPAAEPWYRQAFDRAGELDVRTARLRAATRLARLLAADGDPGAVAGLLGPVHATFTEGHDTVDLDAARDLLASLLPSAG